MRVRPGKPTRPVPSPNQFLPTEKLKITENNFLHARVDQGQRAEVTRSVKVLCKKENQNYTTPEVPRSRTFRGTLGAPGDPQAKPYPSLGSKERLHLDAQIESLKLCTDQLYNYRKAIILPSKIYGYLLNSSTLNANIGDVGSPQKKGANESKSNLLNILGFETRPKDTDELKDPRFKHSGRFLVQQIRQGLSDLKSEVRLGTSEEYGVRFQVDMLIASPTDKLLFLRTAWIYRHKGNGHLDNRPCLTTAFARSRDDTERFIQRRKA